MRSDFKQLTEQYIMPFLFMLKQNYIIICSAGFHHSFYFNAKSLKCKHESEKGSACQIVCDGKKKYFFFFFLLCLKRLNDRFYSSRAMPKDCREFDTNCLFGDVGLLRTCHRKVLSPSEGSFCCMVCACIIYRLTYTCAWVSREQRIGSFCYE